MGRSFQQVKDAQRASRAAVVTEIRRRLEKRDDARAIMQWLVAEHDFMWWPNASPERLRGLYVTCSCTAGPHGLLTNWCAAAERRDGGQP